MAPLSKLRGLLCHVASWWKYDGRKAAYVAADPPEHIARLLLDYGEWHVPRLTGVATRPFLRPDRSLCQTEGYDPASGVLLSGTQTPLLLPFPLTKAAAVAAWDALKTLWKNFPFPTERDTAATLAALLTLIARPAIGGCCPLFAFVSPTPGSGKGLLADVLNLIASGDEATRLRGGGNPDEFQKQMDSIALEGDPVAVIDNVSVIGGEFLDSTTTAKTVLIRLFGTQTKVRVPWRTVLFATGNNLRYVGDVARRVVQITLEPQEEKPDERTDFVHKDLRKHVREKERTYLAHACTILLSYLDAGAPQPSGGYGSFEEWNALVRGCVLWVTGIDPLADQDKQMADDEGLSAWRQLLDAWHTCLGEGGRTLAQALDMLRVHTQQDKEGNYLSPSCATWLTLREALTVLDKKGDATKFDTRSIAAAFSKYKGRILNGRKMIDASEAHKVAVWKVQTVPSK